MQWVEQLCSCKGRLCERTDPQLSPGRGQEVAVQAIDGVWGEVELCGPERLLMFE